MSEQRINKVNISCLEIVDNREQNRGGKFISILCKSRGEESDDLTGSALLLPFGKALTVRKLESASDNRCIAVLKGVHRTDLKRKALIVPSSYAVSAGKDAFFLLPSSKDRMDKGNYFVSGGIFDEYNSDNNRPSASITFHGRVASVRFFHFFPMVTGAKYYISHEDNRDLKTPVTLVFPGKLNQKESVQLSERLLKFGGRPSLKALYSIILRMNSAVELPDYMAGEEFEGSVRSGQWAVMSREYERIQGAILKRSAAFGGVPEKELGDQVKGNAPAVLQIISELVANGTLLRKEGYLMNNLREGKASLSPIASKLLSDLKEEEGGINLSNISNPLFSDTYKALGRLDLIKTLQGDIIFDRDRFIELKDSLLAKVSIGDHLDLEAAKELLPVSRRLLIPILEELDGEGYFERDGETRVVLKKD